MGELLELAPRLESVHYPQAGLRFASDSLPPRDVWKINPDTEILETPVDEFGRVDRYRMLDLVRQTIEPDFEWPTNDDNIHHLFWPHAWYLYDDSQGDRFNPIIFRNQSNHLVQVPRMFHSWLHKIMLSPPLVSAEVRGYMTEASLAANAALMALCREIACCRDSKKVERELAGMTELQRTVRRGKRPMSHRGRRELGVRRDVELYLALKRMRALPVEFQLVDTELPNDQLRLELGRVVAAEALPMMRHAVRGSATSPASRNAQRPRAA